MKNALDGYISISESCTLEEKANLYSMNLNGDAYVQAEWRAWSQSGSLSWNKIKG